MGLTDGDRGGEQPVRHHGGVLIVRRVPRPGLRLSAALTAGETTTALAIAHTTAGGELPSAAWLLLIAVTVYGAAILVLRGKAPLRVVIPALVGAQVVLHAWLVALVADHADHAEHAAQLTAGGALGLSWSMLGAHLLAGAVTAVALVLRRRAVAVLLAWQAQPRPAVPLRSRSVTEAPRALTASVLAACTPTRGPPAAALATA